MERLVVILDEASKDETIRYIAENIINDNGDIIDPSQESKETVAKGCRQLLDIAEKHTDDISPVLFLLISSVVEMSEYKPFNALKAISLIVGKTVAAEQDN